MATKKKLAKGKKKVAWPKKTGKRAIIKKRTVVKKRRPAARKPKAAAKKAAPKKIDGPKAIGEVTHFYREIKVAVVKFFKPVQQGTEVNIRGATTDFIQKLDSMQYDHKPVAMAPKGKQVGIKVKSRVRQGDRVYPA